MAGASGLFSMRDYPLNFEQLHNFSVSAPYCNLAEDELYQYLIQQKERWHFPAVNEDVGALLAFLCFLLKPKRIYEFGSGYGHSAYWYLKSKHLPEDVYLTEKRADLKESFHNAPWPNHYLTKLHYYQGDAFDLLAQLSELDLVLVDGQKADYLRFLHEVRDHLSPGAVIVVDNSYWRGSFLDPLKQNNQSAKQIGEFHQYLKDHQDQWMASFLPFADGVTLIQKF